MTTQENSTIDSVENETQPFTNIKWMADFEASENTENAIRVLERAAIAMAELQKHKRNITLTGKKVRYGRLLYPFESFLRDRLASIEGSLANLRVYLETHTADPIIICTLRGLSSAKKRLDSKPDLSLANAAKALGKRLDILHSYVFNLLYVLA